MNWQLEEDKKKQEALSAALDRLNAKKTEQQEAEAEAVDDLVETACWVRKSVEPPPQLLQETLDRLEAQALLQETAASGKAGLSWVKRRNWLYAGAVGLAASVLLAIQLIPSSPPPVAVAPEEASQTAVMAAAVAPLRSDVVEMERKAEPVQDAVLQVKEEPILQEMPLWAAAAKVATEAGNESSGAVVAWSEQEQKRVKSYGLRAVRLSETMTEPLLLPGEAADLVWHDAQKNTWRHVYRQDTPREVAVTQWWPERLPEKAALRRAAAVLGTNRLVLSREGRIVVLEGRGDETELRKIAAALALPEIEK
nr:hypothetical protein [uncultured Anaeromusa sp.]